MLKITTVGEALKAVEHCCFALEFVEDSLQTYEMCLSAVDSDGYNIQ